MSNFALEKLQAIVGKDAFYQLCIDGVNVLDSFEQSLKANQQYMSELRTLYSYMQYVSDGKYPPHTKYKEIKTGSGKDEVKEFEFKSKHLRLYGIKQPNGKIIITCGFKNAQKKDINAFKELKKRYLEFQTK